MIITSWSIYCIILLCLGGRRGMLNVDHWKYFCNITFTPLHWFINQSLSLGVVALSANIRGMSPERVSIVFSKAVDGHAWVYRSMLPLRLSNGHHVSLHLSSFCKCRFWQGLGHHMSKLLPGQAVIHLMESNVAGNRQGESVSGINDSRIIEKSLVGELSGDGHLGYI